VPPAHFVDERVEFTQQAMLSRCSPEAAGDGGVDVTPEVAFELVDDGEESVVVADLAAEQVERGPAAVAVGHVGELFQEQEQHRAFFRLAGLPAHLERGARGERDEVDRLGELAAATRKPP
jgi:hypothetical protein